MKTSEAVKAAGREYYRLHRAEILERKREQYNLHPEATREKARVYRETHREIISMRLRKWRKEHPETRAKQRSYVRNRLYGISDGGKQLLTDQRGVCAICGGNRSKIALVVDHKHDTNEIRGLLCGRCNLGLGHFDDNPDWLETAAAYLRRTQNPT